MRAVFVDGCVPCVRTRMYVLSGSPLGSFLEVHGEEEAAAAESDDKENAETQVVIDKGTYTYATGDDDEYSVTASVLALP